MGLLVTKNCFVSCHHLSPFWGVTFPEFMTMPETSFTFSEITLALLPMLGQIATWWIGTGLKQGIASQDKDAMELSSLPEKLASH